MGTDMSSIFNNLRNFNADISSWDTSSVTTMFLMFYRASGFNQVLSFDTSKVTTMYGMFQFASAFNQLLSFDTAKVTNMGVMFSNAQAFNQPLSPSVQATTFTTKASLETAVR